MISTMEYDLLRYVGDAGEAGATNKHVAYLYYRVPEVTGNQIVTVNNKLRILESAGLIESRKEQSGERGARVNVWTLTDGGAAAIRGWRNREEKPDQPEPPAAEEGPAETSEPLPAAWSSFHPGTQKHLKEIADLLRKGLEELEAGDLYYASADIGDAAHMLDGAAMLDILIMSKDNMTPGELADSLIVASDIVRGTN